MQLDSQVQLIGQRRAEIQCALSPAQASVLGICRSVTVAGAVEKTLGQHPVDLKLVQRAVLRQRQTSRKYENHDRTTHKVRAPLRSGADGLPRPWVTYRSAVRM